MKHPTITEEQRDRLMKEHGVTSSPMPELLLHHGRRLCAGDVERIQAQLTSMQLDCLPPQTVRDIAAYGRATYDADELELGWHKKPFRVQIKVVEFCRQPRHYENAFVLLIPDEKPWLLAWTGPTKPPMSIFERRL